jgi:hypothetical protein
MKDCFQFSKSVGRKRWFLGCKRLVVRLIKIRGEANARRLNQLGCNLLNIEGWLIMINLSFSIVHLSRLENNFLL